MDLIGLVTNSSAVGDGDGFVMEGVRDFGKPTVGTRRRGVALRRKLHIQGLVRTLGVEDFQEVIEFGLLLKDGLGGRFGGLLLERQMHPFMTTILLGMTGADPL